MAGRCLQGLAVIVWWTISAHYATAWQSAPAPVIPAGGAGPARSIWDGVFSEAQATRGEEVYLEECASCHSKDLTGGDGSPAPPLAGDAFLETVANTTVADFFGRVRETMPLDSPGRLSPRRYADIVAYIFKANRFPTGARELDPDLATLGQIRIENRRPGGK
jgi:mono/diheme cytochrome c family protein